MGEARGARWLISMVVDSRALEEPRVREEVTPDLALSLGFAKRELRSLARRFGSDSVERT